MFSSPLAPSIFLKKGRWAVCFNPLPAALQRLLSQVSATGLWYVVWTEKSSDPGHRAMDSGMMDGEITKQIFLNTLGLFLIHRMHHMLSLHQSLFAGNSELKIKLQKAKSLLLLLEGQLLQQWWSPIQQYKSKWCRWVKRCRGSFLFHLCAHVSVNVFAFIFLATGFYGCHSHLCHSDGYCDGGGIKESQCHRILYNP